MRQMAIRFGEDKRLTGILASPGENSATGLPAVIFLNSGLIHHIGPNRIYVTISRALVHLGYTTFRFDFSGVGDSGQALDNQSYEERSIAEVQAAMDFLEKKQGVKQFILSGICAGADISFYSACADKRVAGIIPIDLYTVYSKAYLLQSYQMRLLNPKSWLNLLRGKSDILQLVRRGFTNLLVFKNADVQAASEDGPDGNPVQKIIKGFDSLISRNVKTLLIYTAGSPAYFNYKRTFEPYTAQIKAAGLLEVRNFQYADHGFTLLHHQEILLQAITDWVSSSV